MESEREKKRNREENMESRNEATKVRRSKMMVVVQQ